MAEVKEQVIAALKALQEEDYTIYNCIATFFTLSVLLYGIRWGFLTYLVPKTANTENKIDDFVVEVVKKWMEASVIILTSAFLATSLFPIDDAVELTVRFLFMAIITWRVARFVEQSIIFFLSAFLLKTEEEKNLLNNFHKVLRIILYTFVAVFVLDNCGFNVSSIVASMGIGGIAIALSVQNILTDAFASFCLLVDKPFEHGDLVQVNGYTGFIDNIGFKTTHIRSLTGEEVVVPNSSLVCATVQNFKKATVINTCFDIGIANTSDDAVVRRVPEIVKGVFESVERANYVLAYFKKFGDYAFIFEIRYTVLSNDADVAREVLGEINTKLNEAFRKEHISAPLPTAIRIQK